MPTGDSVTHWLGQLNDGDQHAAQQLWERYFQRLVGLARKKLRGRRLPAADEEDLALSAFDSFCRAAQKGRFPQIGDRDDLWRLLVRLTLNKCGGHARFEQADCRDVRREGAGDAEEEGPDASPSPEEAAISSIEARSLFCRAAL